MLASHSKVSDVGNATDLPVTSHTNLLHHHTPFAVPTGQKPDKSFALPTSLTPLTSPKVMLQVVLEGDVRQASNRRFVIDLLQFLLNLWWC